MTLEERVMGILSRIPKDSSIDDFIAELELERDLEGSHEEFERGEFHTQDEVEQMVKEWQKSYGQKERSGN